MMWEAYHENKHQEIGGQLVLLQKILFERYDHLFKAERGMVFIHRIFHNTTTDCELIIAAVLNIINIPVQKRRQE